MKIDANNFRKREVEYFYPDDEFGEPYCQIRACGIIFDELYIFEDAEGNTLEYWRTHDANEIPTNLKLLRN